MTDECALIEGPMWADTKFYASWLLAAAEANELWTEAMRDPHFSKRVERLTIVYIPDFNIVATVLLSRLEQNLASFVVSLNDEQEPEEFAIMIGMGFFVLTGDRYQMIIPRNLTLDTVKEAALALAKTEDADYYLHPENIITTIPYEEAKAWQSRLRGMDEVLRQNNRMYLFDMAGVAISP